MMKIPDLLIILVSLFLAAATSLLLLLLVGGGRRLRPNEKRRLPLPLPPGPAAVPILGNLLWLRHSFSLQKIEPLLRELHSRYGPILTLRIGPVPAVFVADRALAHRALVELGAAFADRPPPLPAARFISADSHVVSSAAYGPLWRRLRPPLAPPPPQPRRRGPPPLPPQALRPRPPLGPPPPRRRPPLAVPPLLRRRPRRRHAQLPVRHVRSARADVLRREIRPRVDKANRGRPARLPPLRRRQPQRPRHPSADLQAHLPEQGEDRNRAEGETARPIRPADPCPARIQEKKAAAAARRRGAIRVLVRRLPSGHGDPGGRREKAARGGDGGAVLGVPERRHGHDVDGAAVDHGQPGEAPGRAEQTFGGDRPRGGGECGGGCHKRGGHAKDAVPEGGGAGSAAAAPAGALPAAARSDGRDGDRRVPNSEGGRGELPGGGDGAGREGVGGTDGVPAGAVHGGRRRGGGGCRGGEQGGDQDDAVRGGEEDVPGTRPRPAAPRVLRRASRQGVRVAAGSGWGGSRLGREARIHHRHEESPPGSSRA